MTAPLTGQPVVRSRVGRRVVLVAVGRFDRRVTLAVEQACRIPSAERRALHVATDPDEAEELELRWMDLQPSGLPLDVIEDVGGVAATVAAEVRLRQITDASEVVVLVGRLSMPGVPRRLLHDQTATAVYQAVNLVPGAICVVIPVYVLR